MLHDDRKKAISHFIELNEVQDDETFEISDSRRMSPSSIRRIIMSEINGEEPHTIKLMPKDARNNLIKKLVNENGISKSALERATGISRGTIIRICKQVRVKPAKTQLVPSFLD